MSITPSAGGPSRWVRSSYSDNENHACVEVAALPDAVLVRDSKDEQGPHLTLGSRTWQAFVTYAAAR